MTKDNLKRISGVSAVLAVFALISWHFNFLSPNIIDPDSFYHIRFASILRERGLFDTSFPWTQFSVVRTASADPWYGFHILLIPFTYFSDLTKGIKVAGFFITFTTLAFIYLAFKNLKVKFPAYWPVLLFFSSPLIIWRMIMTRPHPLSLGLVALIFSFFNSGSVLLLFIFSFLLGWIHSSVFWLALVAVSPIILFRWLNDLRIDRLKIVALLGGIGVGLLARPHPFGNLKLIYIQIVDLYLAKNGELASTIGMELQPITKFDGNMMIAGFVALSSIAFLGWLIYKQEVFKKEDKIIILSSLIMSAFSVLLFVTAKRAIDIMTLFMMIFGSSALTYFFVRIEKRIKPEKYKAISVQGLIMMFLLLAFSIVYSSISVNPSFTKRTLLPTKFKEPALWLRDNTKEGEIVFHPYWDQFPPLFFWNQHNYYINGMDPIFLLKYDEKIYWELYYMAVKDMGWLTCGLEQCGPDDIELVPDVLRNDFKASYVFIRRLRQTRLLDYLESDKQNFEKVYDVGNSLIFKVLPKETAKPGKKTLK